MEFKFNEKRNVAVFTLMQTFILDKPILYVSHDEDGAWQFLTGETVSTSDAMIVSLEEVVKRDQTLNELYDLPVGWKATRNEIKGNWQREKKILCEK